ncbi:gamma-glutamyltransferase, partial [Escherichia coli]|uniref:gamma-glutamyltransferase n=1 Tax=Escherichia coli TaxID=562 RepID=UPI003CE451F9
ASQKLTHAYDFRERAPALATRDLFLNAHGEPAAFRYNGADVPDAAVNGLLAVAVPGLVKGLLEVHSQHGKLALSQVLAPAIAI